MTDIEATSKSIRFTQEGVVREIDLEEVPEVIRDTLANLFDKDGDGKISPRELNEVATAHGSMKQQLTLFRRGIVALGVMNLLWFVAMCGVTFAIVSGAKETEVHGRSLYSKGNEPLAMNVNTIKAPLGSYAFMSEDKATSIGDIIIKGNDGEKHYRKMKSADIIPGKAITLETLNGDKIVWDQRVEGGKDILITLADGTAMARPAACLECTASNVVEDDEVTNALEDFLQAIDLEGERNLLSIKC